ncbi:hypothetical protein NQ315_000815 [Exocentrus adspersus]|uniref:Uncharacterized protein n=1 Tax=Exocentrus adspersus TaxID=1586481 RepID=A0AAV8WDN3_9CUCU|nr:hypothetical protein NQ315_000815 [Exocentrus adspersus]
MSSVILIPVESLKLLKGILKARGNIIEKRHRLSRLWSTKFGFCINTTRKLLR